MVCARILNVIKSVTNFFIFAFRNAKKAFEHIENIKMELEEAEKREKEILDEREKLKNDYESSSKKVAQLKVSYSTLLFQIFILSVLHDFHFPLVGRNRRKTSSLWRTPERTKKFLGRSDVNESCQVARIPETRICGETNKRGERKWACSKLWGE